ncbi:hydrogenase expression/formation protein HypE [Campylobacter insulaenigrae]|uniref:hydrogenase expression/formation protein HypE n=1 Tax=Campylobacter insulaenigrae TaxID=260714 RepID=UPI0021524E28|nr:hydrogenase expression/formation protein HypE [Campylobacter insulaenigrae]MCR6570073.1 hydrogenase expression/formation protein HypE [Campylobacter insulaenigrae]MCR6571858.1 hydrogenase expression/formation protein HypE [Campylobacter insulaenigrae]MCR6574510.1 hydrogenase expression/formation protein HypE [Campylobacter insulaenigrae]MCR6576104.1 hydrogenase expression/formation protein HypE [Campylobacter insulaenigrae]MCR6577642.1 hydrogenase expression/formation protein HypE [Campylob
MDKITLAHGGGGDEMNALVGEIFSIFDNDVLSEANDAAILNDIAFSTDSFVLNPIFLKNLDIGKLSVCGSVNDVLMVGAKPLYLSLALILEEGFEIEKLKIILNSIKKECLELGVKLVCGDTKVVPKNKGDEIYINTSCIGKVIKKISTKDIQNNLSIIVSRDIGAHGCAVLVERNNLQANIISDCKNLKSEVEALLKSNIKIKAMRDATRGGLSAVLNEWSLLSGFELLIYEEKIPICNEVLGVCELFGYEPYELANEGTFVLCVEKEDEKSALEILQKFNHNASIIGEVTAIKKSRVVLENAYGARRILEAPKGELLPRIC